MKKKEFIIEVTHFMHNIYHDVAFDLPPHGKYHWATAVDHLADRAHDCYHKRDEEPSIYGIDLKKLARKVVSEYAGNDTALSKRLEERKEKRREPKPPKQPKVKTWDCFPPRNKGVGSY